MHPQEITDSKEVIGNFLRVPVTEDRALQGAFISQGNQGRLSLHSTRGQKSFNYTRWRSSGIAGLIKPGIG